MLIGLVSRNDRPDLPGEQLEEGPLLEDHVPFGKAASGTRITFTHTGVPDDNFGAISKGRRDYHWTPLRKQVSAKRTK